VTSYIFIGIHFGGTIFFPEHFYQWIQKFTYLTLLETS